MTERASWRSGFFDEMNLILLGGSFVLSLAFLSPWPAIVGAAGEIVYLTVGIRGLPFRRHAERERIKRLEQRRATRAEQEERELEPALLGRIEALAAGISALRAQALEAGLDPEIFDRGDRLDDLLAAFRQMMVSHQRLTRLAAQMATNRIEGEIQRLEEALSKERDVEARNSLSQALGLQQRRVTQQGRTEGRRRALEVKLATVETSIDYLKSHIAGGGSEAELVEEIEQILRNATPGAATAAEVESSLVSPQQRLPRPTVIGLGGE